MSWMKPIGNKLQKVILTIRGLLTLGIWLSKANDSDILIMDVEGTDSRERGDEQVEATSDKRGLRVSGL